MPTATAKRATRAGAEHYARPACASQAHEPYFDEHGAPRSISAAERAQLSSLYWLKAEEVAVLLRISRSQAYRRIRDGTLPSLRVGGLIRVRVTDLDALVGDAA